MDMKGFSYMIILQIFQSFVVHGCITPFGSIARKIHILNCEPIIRLIRRYENGMPPLQRLFIKESLISNDDEWENRTQNIHTTMVCCDQNLNIDRAFQSVGREILINYDYSCGDNKFKRVSFGEESTFMSHPWSALLVYNSTYPFQCGGTLITNRYILTAAHCLRNLDLISVRLREHNFTSNRDCGLDIAGFEHCYNPVLELKIDKWIMHPNYSHIHRNNDIGLIRLDRLVMMDRTVRPICLPPSQDYQFDSIMGEIIGWGVTENGTFSDTLMRADVPIHPLDYCRKFYQSSKLNNLTICVAGDNSIATCKGDSGGPLVIRYKHPLSDSNRYYQIALMTYGSFTCGDSRNFPALALRISAYRNWIADNIEL